VFKKKDRERQTKADVQMHTHRGKDDGDPKVFYNFILEASYHQLCHTVLVTQTNSSTVWEGTPPIVEHQEGDIATISCRPVTTELINKSTDLLFNIVLATLNSLHCHINLEAACQFLFKNSAGIFIGMEV
jgi:hypothetical protein